MILGIVLTSDYFCVSLWFVLAPRAAHVASVLPAIVAKLLPFLGCFTLENTICEVCVHVHLNPVVLFASICWLSSCTSARILQLLQSRSAAIFLVVLMLELEITLLNVTFSSSVTRVHMCLHFDPVFWSHCGGQPFLVVVSLLLSVSSIVTDFVGSRFCKKSHHHHVCRDRRETG